MKNYWWVFYGNGKKHNLLKSGLDLDLYKGDWKVISLVSFILEFNTSSTLYLVTDNYEVGILSCV